MPKRRVLNLIKGLGRGGAEMLLAAALPHLDRERFHYEIAYLLPWKDALVPEFEAAGIPVHCLHGARPADPRWLPRLARLLRDGGYDVIHAHSPYPAIGARIAVRMMPRGRRPRIVYTEHNMWDRYHPLTRTANLLTFPLNDHTFAVSNAVRGTIRYPRAAGFLRMPAPETLYEGIDVAQVVHRETGNAWRDEIGIPAGAPVVGTVANLKAHKGLPHLLRAAPAILSAVPDAHIVIVGTGPLEDDLRAQAATLGIGDRVHLPGFRSDVLDLAAGFSVFTIASLHEGFPIALLEAMALGVPIVATKVGGITEAIVDGEHGLLIEPGDVDALADRTIRVLKDPALAAHLGEAARARATEFDSRQACARRESVYEQVLA